MQVGSGKKMFEFSILQDILTINFVKMNLADFIHHFFVIKGNKPKTPVSICDLEKKIDYDELKYPVI